MAKFLRKIDEFAGTQQPFDIYFWFELFTMDLMGELALGSTFGTIEAKDPETGEQMDFIELGAETSLMVAGASMDSVTMKWMIYCLCKNPATKTRLIDQLRAVFSGDPIAKHPLPFTQLNRVPLLECTDTECLRLHPPIGYAIPRRTPSQSAVICGVYIPGGVAVGVPAATLGRNADVYANPDVWDPDRWSDKRADLATMRTSFLGFGHGSRQGMGRIVAMQDITKTVATLLLRYEVELEDAELELGTKEFTIQNPDKPYRVVLRHRAA